MHMFSLDQMIREDHPVRIVVSYVETVDLSELYADLKATTDGVGRDAIDPRILFSLWLFATLESEINGRRIAELTTRHLASMWICGGISVNYHTVCEFRTAHRDLLDKVFTNSIASLHHHGLINLETIAQDGMRVRASAGSGSFRSTEGLEKARQKAKANMAEVFKDENDDEDHSSRSRRNSSCCC